MRVVGTNTLLAARHMTCVQAKEAGPKTELDGGVAHGAVGDGVVQLLQRRVVRLIRRVVTRADGDGRGGDVAEVAVADGVGVRAVREGDGVAANMAEPALRKCHVGRAGELQCSRGLTLLAWPFAPAI